jgi:phosphoenolpyruvate carboxykinase (ATP)
MNYLESISNSLASSSRNSGPSLINVKTHQVYISNTDPQSDFGIKKQRIHYNLTPAEYYEYCLKESGTSVTSTGALSAISGIKTGRSPKDKRIVLDNTTKDIWWDSHSPNIKMDSKTFLINRETAICYLNNQDDIFIFDGYAGWDPEHRIKVRIVAERAYHALFMHNMLIRPTPLELETYGEPDYTIYNAGKFPCNRFADYMTSSTSIDFDFTRKEIIILGTQYAGEMKKGIFTIMHFIMPKKNILSLHSGTNESKEGDVSIFFGLSGTGKTTLSTDKHRFLIGDDEHCWTEKGIFNIEGGCYAKCIGLSKEKEPDIWNSIRFGTVLENVIMDNNRDVQYDNEDITPNTRASYPIDYVENARIPCIAGHPENIIFLTCDAFGVLPIISKLSVEQAMYYFISGYTSKIAGTEIGIKEPQATFSSCFGEAFIVWHPIRYAELLKERIEKHGSKVWLINTGWIGGAYGDGQRCPLKYTRAIIDDIHNGKLYNTEYEHLEYLNLDIPKPNGFLYDHLLNPRNIWVDIGKYDIQIRNLITMFINNFKKYMLSDLEIYGPQLMNITE